MRLHSVTVRQDWLGDLVLTGADPDEVWPLIREYHYSRRMPANIQHCYAMRLDGGLFGDTGEVVAAATFGIPPTRWSEEVLELTRLVRGERQVPLSKLVSFSTGWLKRSGWDLVVSFADWTQGHAGGVYQACSWHFGGKRGRRMDGLVVNGSFRPGRSCNSAWGTRSPSRLKERLPQAHIEPHYDEGKFLYWKPLNVAGKTKAKRLGLVSLPYPKPADRPTDEQVPACLSEVQPLGSAPSIARPAPPQQEAMDL